MGIGLKEMRKEKLKRESKNKVLLQREQRVKGLLSRESRDKRKFAFVFY